MTQRLTQSVAFLLALAFLSAVGRAEPAAIEIPAPADGDTTQRADLKPPPGVDSESIAPHNDQRLPKAQMTLDAIVAELGKPTFAAQPIEDHGEPTEPPLAAQMAYAAGRQAWLEGRNFEATRQLEMAQRLAPNEPQIQRMLAMTNAIKGADHLRRALELDPTDLASAFDLGRLQLDQRHWSDAIATLAHAQSLQGKVEGADPVRMGLIHFYLGSALKQEGYDAAAIDHLMRFLNAPSYGNFASPLAYQLMLARRQSGMMWQTVGDSHNRLSQPAKALAAYREAGQAGVAHEQGLVARGVYTLLRLGRDDDARQLTVDFLAQPDTSPKAFELAGYLKQQGVAGGAIAEQLKPVYLEADRPAQMAMLIAEMSDHAASATFLRDHLKAKPRDRVVFTYMLKQQMDDSGKLTADHLAPVLEVVAAAIEASQGAGSDFVDALFEAVGDPAVVKDGIAALPEETAKQPAMRFLNVVAMALLGDSDAAIEAMEKVVADAPDLTPARVMLAKQYMASQQFDKAAATLKPLEDNPEAQIVMLRARVLAQAGKPEEAIKLLDTVIERGIDTVALIIEKARLQLQSGDGVGAERTLLDALATRPEAEEIYESLFQLYDSPSARIPDSTNQYQRLMWRLLRAIPESRIARIKLAEQYMTDQRTHAQAEQLLRALLADDARDWRAMSIMLELYAKTDRNADAVTLLVDRLAKTPNDPGLVLVAVNFYAKFLTRSASSDMQEKLLLALPPSSLRTLELSRIYASADRHDEAIALLKADGVDDAEIQSGAARVGLTLGALEDTTKMDALFVRYTEALPTLDAELRFWWAVAYERKGNRARAVELHKDNLTRHPDHAQTNNTLGYLWAYGGDNLEEAKALITRAVEAEPNNGAYLDSMGWVHYKLGNYDEAVTWLKRATVAEDGANAIIYDHVGDALFRSGDEDGAANYWQRAMRLYKPSEAASSNDPETKSLGQRLRLKLNAMRNKSRPPLSEVPGVIDEPDAAQPEPEPAPGAAAGEMVLPQ